MWSAASEGYKGDILKVAFENFNIDATGPGILSGYELWLGFDWFGASNGLVGGHGNQPRSKPGFSNSSLRSVQREVMVLAKTPMALQRAAYAPGQEVEIELLLKNMTLGGFPHWGRTNPMLKWRATMGGKVVASHSAPLALGSIGKPNALKDCDREDRWNNRGCDLSVGPQGKVISGLLSTRALPCLTRRITQGSWSRRRCSLSSPGATRGRSASFRGQRRQARVLCRWSPMQQVCLRPSSNAATSEPLCRLGLRQRSCTLAAA